MRYYLLLAFILYDIIAQAQSNYDYDELEGKRHAFSDDRRNYRKKALMESDNENSLREPRRYAGPAKSAEAYEEDGQNWRKKRVEQGNDNALRRQQRYNGVSPASAEFYDYDSWIGAFQGNNLESPTPKIMQPSAFHSEKDQKTSTTMNCDRPHERYEPCFSGCAAVSCDNPRDRLRPCYPFCESGCICVPPYVRDDRTHKCVLPDECTKGLKGVPDIGDDA